MGNSNSSRGGTPAQRQARSMSRAIDVDLAASAEDDAGKVKLLLLGAGESGKTTFLKQSQLLYGGGVGRAECRASKPFVYNMIVTGMKILTEHVDAFGLTDGFSGAEKAAADAIQALPPGDTSFNAARAAHVKTLWESGPIQTAWDRRAELQIPDTTKHYFDSIDRISAANYVPTVDDFLFLRVRTTGIVERDLVIDSVRFQFVDVGGQRSERKKWLHCFDEVSGVIFVAALSEYDQRLFEDESQNRMVEAISLFEEICETPYFMHKPMLLFLNKSDLFREKIAQVDIADQEAFADFGGRKRHFQDGVDYFMDKFLERNRHENRKIFAHVTCATDSTDARFVFETCRNIVLEAHLQSANFL